MSKKQSMIWVNIKTSKEKVDIEIRDNGTGIAQEHLNKIFDMFYRVSSKEMGSGIGLYIVNEIINRLGGNIQVDSSLKKGSSFIMEIPNNFKI